MATVITTTTNVPRPQSSRRRGTVTTDVSADDFGNVPVIVDELEITEQSVPHPPTEGWFTHACELSNQFQLIMQYRAMR